MATNQRQKDKAKRKRPEELLQEAAAALKSRSSGMSLRAVAARLDVSPSYWSKILRGEKPLSEQLLPRVVKVLALDAQQIARLQRSILETIEEERLAPATGIRTAAASSEGARGGSQIDDFRDLGKEHFWILEEWYYIPILNLFTLTTFPKTTEGIAERLGLKSDKAAEAVDRLRRHGFLKASAKGEIERTDLLVRFPTDRSYPSIRRYHQAMLQKARLELTREGAAETFEGRLISAICFAGSSEKIREARLILEEAMYRVSNLMTSEPVSDEIYQLNVQLFPLTKG